VMIGLFEDSQIAPLKALVDELHRRVGCQDRDPVFSTWAVMPSPFEWHDFHRTIPPGQQAYRRNPAGDDPGRHREVQEAYVLAAERPKEAGVRLSRNLVLHWLSRQSVSFTGYQSAVPIEYGGTSREPDAVRLEVISKVKKGRREETPLGIRVSGNELIARRIDQRGEAQFGLGSGKKLGIHAVNVTALA